MSYDLEPSNSGMDTWMNIAGEYRLTENKKQKIIATNNEESIKVHNYLIFCDKINKDCQEKVLKKYLKKENEKLELENKALREKVEELKADNKFICGENKKFNKQKIKAKADIAKIIKRMENIISTFDGVNTDVHSSLIVKLFRNAIKVEHSENKIISEINKLKNPVERRLDEIGD